jgi:hypothetical protein
MICLAGFCMSIVLAVGAQAQPSSLVAVFDRLPVNTDIAVVIPSMEDFAEAATRFGTDTGLTARFPELDEPLSLFKRQMGMLEGVEDDAPLIFAFSGVSDRLAAGDGGGPMVGLMMVPVSDYNRFVSRLGGDPAQPMTTIQPSSGRNLAVKASDGYAIVTNNSNASFLETYQPSSNGRDLAQAISATPGGDPANTQVLLWLNFEKLGPAVQTYLQSTVRSGGQSDNWSDLLRSVSQLGADRLWTQSTTGLVSLSLNEQAMGLTISMVAKPDTDLADLLTPTGNPNDARANRLLTSAPDRAFIYAAAIDHDASGLVKLLKPVLEALQQQPQGISAYFYQSLSKLGNALGTANVFYAPTDPGSMLSGGLLQTLTLYQVADGAGFVKQHREATEAMRDLTLPLALPGDTTSQAELSFDTTYTPAALNIEGVSVDQYQVTANLPPELTRQFNTAFMFIANSGYGGYVAHKDDTVVLTTATEPQFISRALRSVGSGEGIGSAGPVARVRDELLPHNASVQAYLSLAGIAQSANLFLPMFADMQTIDVPDALPPLAFGAASRDGGVSLRLVVPTETAAFAVDVYEQFSETE